MSLYSGVFWRFAKAQVYCCIDSETHQPMVLHTLPCWYSSKGRICGESWDCLSLYRLHFYFSSTVWLHKYLDRWLPRKNQFILLVDILKIVHKSKFVSAYSVMLCVHCNKIIFLQHGGKMKYPSSPLSPWDCQYTDYLLENISKKNRTSKLYCPFQIQDVCICQ